MIQATASTPRSAEMPETVLTKTTREFSQKFANAERRSFVKNTKKKSENRPFLSDSYRTVGSPVFLVR